jgi:hypothetical protein
MSATKAPPLKDWSFGTGIIDTLIYILVENKLEKYFNRNKLNN